jgi:hypothetical protein
MYDTINIWIGRAEAGDLTASTLCLTNVKETADQDTGEVWTCGNLDNLKVTVSTAGVSVKGSLAKFYFPDNTYTLNCKQVKQAIEKLSDTLRIDISEAKITRLDVSTNFIMRNKAQRYYDVLGLCTYFNRVQATPSTLYYHSKGKDQKRTLIFYDKAREVSGRNGIVPAVFKNENLLRYESRWNTRLPRQLQEREVIGKTLYDRQFYSKIVGLWGDSYFRIGKQRNINIDAMDKIKTVSDATDFICAIALQKLPPDEVQNLLEDMKRKNLFSDRNNYTRLKKKLKDISGKTEITEVDSLAQELDTEVRNVLAYKR